MENNIEMVQDVEEDQTFLKFILNKICPQIAKAVLEKK